MRPTARLTGLITAAVLLPTPALAQSSPPSPPGSPVRLTVTPYIGLLIPTRDLLEYHNRVTKLSIAVTWGARLGLAIRQRVQIDGDVGYSPGSLEFTQTGTDVNESVRVLSGGGRLTLFLIPRDRPFWIGVSGGVGAVRHTFSSTTYIGVTDIQPGTQVGALVGAAVGIRLGRVLAINIGAEDHLYNASFDVNGTKTAEKTQHDIRISGGVHIPFLGF